MLRFFETVFVQPALKSDRSPSVNITLRAVTSKQNNRYFMYRPICLKIQFIVQIILKIGPRNKLSAN